MLQNIFKSFLSKVILFTTLLIVGILAFQSAIYIQLETQTLENALIENKKDFTELLAMNLGAAQSLGGFAFQSQLIDESGRNKDTVFVRFVKPDGEIYLSSIRSERGEFLYDPAIGTLETIIRDETYKEEDIKTVISAGSGGYTAWLGFSLNSIKTYIKKTIISRILISIGILLVGILLSYLSATKVTRDISELKKSAEKIGSGDLNIKVNIKSADEIGDLGQQFNKMTQKLRESRKNIKEAKTNAEKEKAKLATLLSGLGEGVIAIDLEGRITVFNKQAQDIFGKTPEQCIGEKYYDIFHFRNEKDEAITMNNYPISEVIKNKKTIFLKAYFIRKNKHNIPVAIVAAPIIFRNKLLGIVGTFRDITEEEKIDRAKTEFVYLASHQLQTPLTAVKWFMEILLKKEKLNKKQKEYVRKAYESNEKMIRLVEDFLNISRLEDKTVSVISKEIDAVAFMKELIEEAEILAKEKEQKIKFKSSHKKILCCLDPNLIGQVISNLLSNAIHYSHTKTTIDVSLKKNKNNIEIKIADQGIGIGKKDTKKLFTKFFRTHRSIMFSAMGSGLGLYIVKKILDICEGKIECDSEEGEGTTFTVFLPIIGPNLKREKKLIENKIS